MSIELYFSLSRRTGDSIAEKNELNKEIVEGIISKFEGESDILKSQNIFLFFNWTTYSFRGDKLGSLIIKNTPSYPDFKNRFPYLELEISNFSDFEFQKATSEVKELLKGMDVKVSFLDKIPLTPAGKWRNVINETNLDISDYLSS